MDFQTLRLTFDGLVARITLAAPGSDNRIGLTTLSELSSACESIEGAEGVSLVVVEAEGPGFCAGWERAALRHLQTTSEHLDPFGCLAGLPMPVLAALHGGVVSAGLELALACDLRIARDDARFSLPEVIEGVMPVGGATARLPRIAGRTVATAMLLLGEELDAAAAYRCGLVSRVAAAAGFAAEVEAVASRVAGNGPIALRYAKEAILNGIELPLDQALRYELDLSIILQTTRDRAEGVDAFLDKRTPRFEGR